MSNKHVVRHVFYNKVCTNTVVIIICLFSYLFLSKQELTTRPFLTSCWSIENDCRVTSPCWTLPKMRYPKRKPIVRIWNSAIDWQSYYPLSPWWYLFIEWKIYTIRNRLMLYIPYGKSTNNRYRADSLRWELLCDQTADSILKSFMKFIQWKGRQVEKRNQMRDSLYFISMRYINSSDDTRCLISQHLSHQDVGQGECIVEWLGNGQVPLPVPTPTKLSYYKPHLLLYSSLLTVSISDIVQGALSFFSHTQRPIKNEKVHVEGNRLLISCHVLVISL